MIPRPGRVAVSLAPGERDALARVNSMVLELADISLPAGLMPLTRAAIVFGALMLYLAERES